MLNVVCFKWNSTYKIVYNAYHVNVLEAMVRRHYAGPLRFVCVTDDPAGIKSETFPLWDDCSQLQNASGSYLPSCYRRLKLFDPDTQAQMGIASGERIVMLDLDLVLTGDCAPLWDRDEDFIGWAVPGTHRKRVFNGSMWLLKAGRLAEVWREFDPVSSPKIANQAEFLGSDQAWISFRTGSEWRPGWTDADGVVSYPRVLARLPDLPADVRVAVFHGFQKPWAKRMPEWVARHYIGGQSGRCLVLGYGETLWPDVEAALQGPIDGVVASPEAAEHWPGPVTAIAWSDEEAMMIARQSGYDEIVLCGGSAMDRAAFLSANGIGESEFTAFLSYLGGEVVDYRTGDDGHRHYVVTVDHGGERHRYGAHDVRMLAARAAA